MKLYNLLWWCLVYASLIHATHSGGHSYYKQAKAKLQSISKSYTRNTIYTLDNIDGNLYIPQFNNETKNYDQNISSELNPTPIELTSEVVPLLEQAISLNHTRAMVMLADLYLFGNYSMPTNYTRAKELYHQAVSLSANGHAYFMLGFIYSTGLFGEFEVNQKKANLYYQFGVENGDLNSLSVMAWRHNRGVDVPPNSTVGLEWLNEQQGQRGVNYDIRISDFNGGLYGDKMSETPSSIEVQSRVYSDLKSQLEEYSVNTNDQEFMAYYFQGLEGLKGDYFTPRNYTWAFEQFSECVQLGVDLYEHKNTHMSSVVRMFLSSCQARLAKMYLFGTGVPQNVTKAKELYDESLKVQSNAEALNDLGVIAERGLLGPANETEAVNYYVKAVKSKSHEAYRNLSLLLLKMSGGTPHSSEFRKDIFTNMKEAAYSGDIEALFHYGNYLQSGLSKYAEPDSEVTCPGTIQYYKIFIERLTQFFAPHLKYAFEELISGNFKNALVGYSIAAEQGFEPAQISAAYLLYQLQPLYSPSEAKTFNRDRVNLAIRYLERASKQGNDDATVLLGDLFSGSYTHPPNIPSPIDLDHERAFKFYRIASDRHSSHGAYKLGEMYEYGVGPSINNSIDYFMAKRYYDSSLQYKERFDLEKRATVSKSDFAGSGGYSKAHISLALLRLRIKYVFNKSAFKGNHESEGGWLNAFRKVKKNSNVASKEPVSKVDAHAEGKTYVNEQGVENYVEDYDIGDYLVISLTCMFFIIFFVQNIIRSIRRMRNNRQGNEDEDDDKRMEWQPVEF
ncbi:uncharacterized protein SPAPADRAFT_68394 [Spathaspora passalidarum NRRL Y-27907]|uniref:ERAD-associated E3 ubiquitin-protein ligase component HRD3 n=1 Tax=Spathaspora passalidarum (strain NRRL Y-27907 / 11-Y1) TaxID=619300 RepID=G3ATP7_SPAPN|nr:uncharacterized protein SPAPADRAFT_68394 [Spathaspora passalidarum NRRL Y-27907]EGW30273.1 hypothetical protein SPAPADRAFT_68394 [Spathaspora passalidarum NRRL Y-27907]